MPQPKKRKLTKGHKYTRKYPDGKSYTYDVAALYFPEGDPIWAFITDMSKQRDVAVSVLIKEWIAGAFQHYLREHYGEPLPKPIPPADPSDGFTILDHEGGK